MYLIEQKLLQADRRLMVKLDDLLLYVSHLLEVSRMRRMMRLVRIMDDKAARMDTKFSSIAADYLPFSKRTPISSLHSQLYETCERL